MTTCRYSLFFLLLAPVVWCGWTNLSEVLVQRLVTKYGVDDGSETMSMEDFERFVTNCNLGRVRHAFAPSSSDELTPTDSTRQDDCQETSVENSTLCRLTKQCLSSVELMDFVVSISNSSPPRINGETLMQLCPILLTQIESQACMKPQLMEKEHLGSKPSHLEVWGYGILFVTFISLCSLVGVSVIPAMGKEVYDKLLTFLIGLAVGSLSGSAVFHLLPQAYGLIHPEETVHDYLWVSLVVVGGIYLFFMTERCMKIFIDARKRKLQHLIGSCSDNDTLQCTPSTISEEYRRSMGDIGSQMALNKPTNQHILLNDKNQNHNSDHLVKKGHHGHEHHIEFSQGQNSTIATVAWMIIFGDGLHNFIDGLSIGAAFNQNIMTGISISVAVVCEEFPHELGDFAVLLKAGMSMRQAMAYNFLSACTCYLGLIVGILLGELETAGTYIFALAGGVFLYISLVDMIPELNEAVETASKESVRKALYVLFLQNLGWCVGIVTLFLLAYYNSAISFE